MTTLWWVRHGPTHAKTMVGWSDLPADLSDHAALGRVAEFLPRRAAVISSDLSRAVTTADAIQGARSRLPHDPALREVHFGEWEGRAFDEIEAESPDLIRAYWDNPGDLCPPGGESWHQAVARTEGAVARLCKSQAGGDVIVVAHFGVIVAQLQQALGLTPYEAFGHRIANLSVTRTIWTGRDWQADLINHCP